MADFTKPALTSKYTEFITELKERDEVVGSLYSTDVTVTNIPADNSGDWGARSIRWNATNSYFQRRNAANNDWERLEGNAGTHKFVNLEAGNITATSALSGASVSTSGQVQGGRINVTGSTTPANGFYLPATNQLRLTTGSSDRITILSDGKTGIGTTNPNEKLEVVGNVRIQSGSNPAFLEIGAGGSGNRFAYIDLVGDQTYTDFGLRLMRQDQGANAKSELVHRGTGNFVLEAADLADLIFQTASTTRMCVDSGGNVGIGNFSAPEDPLHIKQATNNITHIKVQNNEGFARYGTDGGHAIIDCDVHKLRSSAGSSYLETSSSLFDIKTAAKANSMSFTNNIQPSFGNSMTKGINWAENAHGIGSGDKAYIRYYSESGENTRLLIGIENDSEDDIYLSSSLVHTSSNFSVNGTCTATTFSGSGSSLTNVNATTLDNIDSSKFLRSDTNDECEGIINFSAKKIGLGTTPASTFGNRNAAIAMGDNDTGIAQNGDGELELWSNNDEVVNINQNNVVVNVNLLPKSSGSGRNLGSTSNRWENLYINDLQMSNKGKQNDVDGTWGDYTIQEGYEDLYLINHRTGKKFKFALIPVAN